MTLPREEFSAICHTANRLQELVIDGKKRITRAEASKLLRHFPGPLRLFAIFEGKNKGHVTKEWIRLWTEQK